MITDFVVKTKSKDERYTVVVKVDREGDIAHVYEMRGTTMLRARSADYDEVSTPEAAEAWIARPVRLPDSTEDVPYIETLAAKYAGVKDDQDDSGQEASGDGISGLLGRLFGGTPLRPGQAAVVRINARGEPES